MTKITKGFVTIGLAVGMVACATTGQKNIQLIGDVPNPSAPVLSGLCLKQCNANACTNYNAIVDACEHGLPIQGVAGGAALAHFCPINNYPYMGTLPYIQLPDTCIVSTPTPAAS